MGIYIYSKVLILIKSSWSYFDYVWLNVGTIWSTSTVCKSSLQSKLLFDHLESLVRGTVCLGVSLDGDCLIIFILGYISLILP